MGSLRFLTGRAGARRRAVAIGCALLLCIGCGPSDPVERVLEERARWSVDVLSFVQSDPGTVRATCRLSGPPSSAIDTLTVRFSLIGSEGTIEEVWYAFDLTEVERGGPADVLAFLPVPSGTVETLELDPVLRPSEPERDEILELRGMTSPS